jgi:predicted  nucleic acid-binding Zn-ribbon protein
MANGDNNKVVKLRQPQVNKPVAASSVDEAITPKSLLDMSDLEQDAFLSSLRDRRMRAAEALRAAQEAKRYASSVQASVKLEKKADQVQRQLDRAGKALDKLEELIYDLRALTLQHTDMDITDATKTNHSPTKS